MTLFMDGPLADVTTMACFYTFLAGPSFVLCFRRFLTSPRFVTTVVSVLDWTQTTMYYYRLQLCTREQRLRKRGEPEYLSQLMPLGSSEDTNSKLDIILIVAKKGLKFFRTKFCIFVSAVSFNLSKLVKFL